MKKSSQTPKSTSKTSKARRRLIAVALGFVFLFLALTFAELGLRFFRNTWGSHFEARNSFSSELLAEPGPATTQSESPTRKLPIKKLPIETKRIRWQPGPTKLIPNGRYTAFSKKVGFHARPSAAGSVRREDLNGNLIYDVEYRFNSLAQRETSTGSSNPYPALFVGCSVTLGEGVAHNQNFAAIFGLEQSKFRPLVQAFHAWGPGNILNFADDENFGSDLRDSPETSKNGIAVYTYIDHHLNRTVGASDLSLGPRWYESISAFSTEDGRTLVNEGQMSRAWPYQILFYSLYERLLKTSLLAGMTLPELPVFKAKHFDLLALVIDEMGRKIRTRTSIERFVVVIFPGSTTARWLTPRLKARGIEVLDYSKMNLSDYAEPAFIRLDGHPTRESHQVLGRLLAHDLLVPPLSE